MSKRGDMFRRIFTLLEEGYNAAEIIKMGYSARTVYWAADQRKTGKKPEVRPGEKHDWVTIGLTAGWIHRCDDGSLAVLVDETMETDQGIIYQLTCPRCKKVIVSRFEKWVPAAKKSYDTEQAALYNIATQATMKALI